MRWPWLPVRGKALILCGIIGLFFYVFHPLLLVVSAVLIVAGVLTVT